MEWAQDKRGSGWWETVHDVKRSSSGWPGRGWKVFKKVRCAALLIYKKGSFCVARCGCQTGKEVRVRGTGCVKLPYLTDGCNLLW